MSRVYPQSQGYAICLFGDKYTGVVEQALQDYFLCPPSDESWSKIWDKDEQADAFIIARDGEQLQWAVFAATEAIRRHDDQLRHEALMSASRGYRASSPQVCYSKRSVR